MKTLKKYLLLCFLIENLLAQSFFASLPTWVFYLMLFLGVLMLFSKEFLSRRSFKECWPLYLLLMVYVLYQFTAGIGTLNTRSLLYLMAKVTTFAIITVSVVSNLDYYVQRLPILFAFIVFIVLLFGMGRGVDLDSGDRMNLGFGNSNSTSSLSVICIAGVLFFWNRKYSFIYMIMLAIALFAMLAGGGRNAILTLVIMTLVWTGFSLKKSIIAALLLALSIGALTVLPVNLAGVNRMKDTIEGKAGSNRDIEREATKIMIDEKPLTGWGFEAKNSGRAADISELGSHSGYLETIKCMGWPFSILWFFILLLSILPLLKYLKGRNMVLRYHLAIVLSHLAAAFFEGLFVGVHEFSTNIVFYSLAVLTTYRYREKHHLIQQYDKAY